MRALMKFLRFVLVAISFLISGISALVAAEPAGPAKAPSAKPGQPETPPGQPATSPFPVFPTRGLPYVYTNWKHITTKEGLPNDHIFSVKADGPRVWVGTENGLACLDKRTGKIRSWKQKKEGETDGLPWKVVTAIDVDPKTGDVWLGLFGGGIARFSGGRFDHFHQLNSGLVNDVVYGIAVQDDNVWVATTAGANRYNQVTGQWVTFTEKNAPMEEIWNYAVSYNGKGKIFLGVWGSGCLEFDVKTERWTPYLDPDGEMEIDLFRDDGIIHVIVTGASEAEDILWISTYFGTCRYDRRNWRGFYALQTGLPSDFTNNVKARNANECWFSHDKGLGVIADFPTMSVVAYTRDPDTLRGKAKVYRDGKLVTTVDMEKGVPHSFNICADIDGNDVWVGTSKGLGWAIGTGYYPGVKEKPEWLTSKNKPAPSGPK